MERRNTCLSMVGLFIATPRLEDAHMPVFKRPSIFGMLDRRASLGVFICLALYMAGASAAEPKSLVLSVIPRLPATVIHRDWSPFSERLAQAINMPVELRIFDAFADFESYAVSGQADLVFANPYQLVLWRRHPGFIPLVRDDARQLSGILVVRSDNPITSVHDLDGKQIAFPHPNAFGASLYMRALLEREFGIRFTPVYVTSHANVYRNVILGKAAAGGGVNITLNLESPSVRSLLRVLYETPGVAAHPLSAHPRLSAALREKITNAVLRMSEDEVGRGILHRVALTQPVRADYARDYQRLENLRLDKYYVDTGVDER